MSSKDARDVHINLHAENILLFDILVFFFQYYDNVMQKLVFPIQCNICNML